MPKSLEELARDVERKEYAARCAEVTDLRRRLLETELAGEDIRQKNIVLLYERDRVREVLASARVQCESLIAEREAAKSQLEAFADKCNGYAREVEELKNSIASCNAGQDFCNANPKTP